MRTTFGLLLAAAVALPAHPSDAAQGVAEVAWSDTVGSSTLVEEKNCVAVSGPAPYNLKCDFTAVADNRVTAPSQRGECSEVLATLGPRRVDGPCRAAFAIIGLRVHRVSTSATNTTCGGTSLGQQTGGSEPVPLRGRFQYENTDGLVRSVNVDVVVTGNVLTFSGSVARVDTEEIVDEVEGAFTVRCRNGTAAGFSGNYDYIS